MIGVATFGSPSPDIVVASLTVVRVAQDEIQEDQERHPQGEEDEGELGRAVEGEAQRHLRDPEQCYGAAAPAVKMNPQRAAPNVLDEAATNRLEEDQDVDGYADSVVGVGEAPRRADCEKAEDKDDGYEPDGEDLEVGMISCVGFSGGPAEPLEEDRTRDDEEECYSSENPVRRNYAVVLGQG